MKYLKVWVSFRESLKEYSDAEKGRLFDAMLAYADSGEEPHFTGNERFIWGSVKQTIDLTRETSEKRKTTGSMGGTAAAENREIANGSKPQQNIANGSKPLQPEASISSKEKKRNVMKNLLDDEEDDEEESSPGGRADYTDEERAVFDSFWNNIARMPNPAEVKLVARCAALLKLSPEMAAEAVRIAAQAGAMNIAGYAKQVMNEWDYQEIRTIDEAAEYRYMKDNHADQDELDNARQRRKEAHERGETA